MIRTIIFDMGKVLIPFDFQLGYNRIAELAGCEASAVPERLRQYDSVQRFESGAIEPRAFVDEINQILGTNYDYDVFCEIWSSIFLTDTLIPESLLEALHRRYRLVLLSNTNAIHFPMVRERYPILNHFDAFVLSHEVGAMKPSPKMYEAAVAAAQCRPEECFFTDDIAEYVEGAKQYGIDAVRFESAEQIERELTDRGVDWQE
ncbi:MAG: HAD family phosphatase [Bryobacteraceae bacterium]|nr:HAD family phosphatase [Bryobacteraceae bacterium]